MATTKKTATKTAKAAPKKAATKCCAKKACASKTCAKKACAKKQQDEKHKFIIFGLVLTLVILGSSLGVITWARYTSEFTGYSMKTQVAKWSAALKDGAGNTITGSTTLTLNATNPGTDVVEGKIAPGSTATGSLMLDLTGTEVNTDIEFEFTKPTGIPANATLTASVSPNTNLSCTDSGNKTTCAGTISLPKSGEKYTAFTSDNGKFTLNAEIVWTYADNPTENAEDNTAGATAAEFTIPVTITAKQHYQTTE